jgi:hypothetical protein
LIKLVALVLLAIALVACGSTATQKQHIIVDKNTPILKIAVFSDGRLTVDGAPSSIQELRESLHKLSEEKGAVWYFREAGKQNPPPIAMEALKEVIAARLPIRLSSKPDYSDSVTP